MTNEQQETPVIDEQNFVNQEKKRKERLTRSMLLNGFLILMAVGISVSFALPQYEEISAKVAESNDLISKIDSLRNNGMTPEQFSAALSRVDPKAAKNPIFSDKEKIAAAMEKDPTYQGTYYEWLNQEVGKASMDRYDQIIAQKREIVGNVIPTFAESLPGDDLSFDKDRVTLATFVRHIEESIFKQFKVSTFGQLGIDKVTFDGSKNSVVNIGSFKLDFPIEGENKQILKLVEYVQNSGKIKVENGKLVPLYPVSKNKKNPSLSELNNLLITIDSIQADKSFVDPDMKNNVRISLVFYVKGRTYASLVEIRTIVADKIKKLRTEVEGLSKKCNGQKDGVCATDAGATAIGAIKNLVPEITAIDNKSQETVKNATVNDLGAEFDKVFSLYASARTIETSYLKQKAILERPPQKGKATATPAKEQK
ncbi:MAG: hypothetical protein QG650_560 [Patescibacteria group bacterium]|nr:hypothetical protein [Patescibacteria group bacterium]